MTVNAGQQLARFSNEVQWAWDRGVKWLCVGYVSCCLLYCCLYLVSLFDWLQGYHKPAAFVATQGTKWYCS